MRVGNNYKSYAEKRLSSFASYVYGWVAAGLAITATVAYTMYATSLHAKLLSFWWVWALCTLGISFYIRFQLEKMSSMTLSTCFILYSVCEGLFFGSVLPLFSRNGYGSLVWVSFGVAALMFTGAALYGSFTKVDLTSYRNLLSAALLGFVSVTLCVLVASFFWRMKMMHLILSYCGLALFMSLTVFEAQRIQKMSTYVSLDSPEMQKVALMSALGMYTNMITIFWYVLRILSHDRDS